MRTTDADQNDADDLERLDESAAIAVWCRQP
jgi:hypothetical protein